ncbi:Aspartate aminotransferase [BD1-7 clade bacterium]|uniref:Aminotransferase n=1 Tax=BD1-7 clade bacterium TaxID=2029982 RepID=A0A5S9MWW8_9GAMM|nr:Aspartate aminotransferase [BD1-7 clade bacterium]
MPRTADRLRDIAPFRVVEVLSRAKELEAAGRDIVHMEAGEPDFATIQPIIDAAKSALDDGATYYTGACGIPELREAVAGLYKERYQLDIPASRILITPGASGALLLIAAYLMNPGDGMMMTDPGYPCNRNFMRLVEGEGQLVAVDPADRYQLTAAIAEKNWQDNTVGALVASPANPTGEILTRQQLSDLYDITHRHGGNLIVDEIYHGLTFGVEAPSILEVTDQAFVINSFSKYFGMTGWRLGWMVAPEYAIEGLERLAQNLFISMSTMAQYGALAGFEPDALALLEERRNIFHERRDYLVPALRELGFGISHVPDGAFYVYADISRFSDDSLSFCKMLLEDHGVAVTPGADFGHHKADTHVRFAYTTSMERLQEGVRRLRAVLAPT